MRRKCVSLIAALLALTMLAGCNKISSDDSAVNVFASGDSVESLDAEGIYEKMQQAVDGRLASAFTATTNMGAKMSAAVLSMEAELTAATDVKLTSEPFAFYSDTTLEASLFGADISESFQAYSRTDDGTSNSYFHVGSSDTWFHQQINAAPTDLLGQYSITGCPSGWVPQNLTLEEQTQIVDSRNAYVLSCTFSAADVLSAISSPLGEISLDGMDLTGVQLATTYYVDSETFLPVRIETEYRGIGAVIGDLFNQYAAKMLGNMGTAVEAEVNSYREVLSGLTYGPVEVPLVPEEGVQNSKDAADFNILESLKLF